MENRLADLKGSAAVAETVTTDSEFMSAFYKEVEAVKDDISKLGTASEKITDLKKKSLLSTTADSDKGISGELAQIMKETNGATQRSHAWLKKLRSENDSMKTDPLANKSELRIRSNMHATLARKFMDSVQQYEKAQQAYQSESRKKLTRQIQTVKPDATEEEIDQVIAEGSGNTIFKDAILKGPSHSTVLDAHRDVTSFYEDVVKLEKSMQELNQMFKDMAILVDMQGETIDRIQYDVQGAALNVEKGNKELESAIEHAKKARRRQCCLVLLVIIILIIFTGGGVALFSS